MSALRQRFYMLPKLSTVLGRFRPWTMDHFVATFSWLVVGNALFFVVGTTTFVSLVLWVANTLQFQGANPLGPPGNGRGSAADARLLH